MSHNKVKGMAEAAEVGENFLESFLLLYICTVDFDHITFSELILRTW